MFNILKYKGVIYVIPFFIAFFFLQLPFLEADPALELGEISRDALTDEGLNTSQLTNFVNSFGLGMNENANLIKSPAFNAFLYPAYLFSTNLFVSGRVWMLLTYSLLLAFILKSLKLNWKMQLLSLVLFLNFYLFQYARFTMAESFSSLLIFVSLLFLTKYLLSKERKYLFFSTLSLFVVFCFKIQFLYLFPLPILVFFALYLTEKTVYKREFFMYALTLVILFILFFLLWIFPNMDTFLKVMQNETSGRLMHPRFWTSKAYEQFSCFVLNWENSLLLISYVFSLIFFILFRKRVIKNYIYFLSVATLVWSLLEFHKFFLWYLPPRYLVPTFTAMSFFCLIQGIIIFKQSQSLVFRSISLILIISLGLSNTLQYQKLYKKRTYFTKNENKYFQDQNLKGRTIAGVWGCIFAKNSGAKTIPVWNDFFNDKNLLLKHKPAFILTEIDEDESACAFENNGINLDSMFKKKRFFQYGKYKICVYDLR